MVGYVGVRVFCIRRGGWPRRLRSCVARAAAPGVVRHVRHRAGWLLYGGGGLAVFCTAHLHGVQRPVLLEDTFRVSRRLDLCSPLDGGMLRYEDKASHEGGRVNGVTFLFDWYGDASLSAVVCEKVFDA